jgi:dipeptidase E
MVKGVFVGSGSEGMQSPEVVQACLSLTSSSTPTVLYIGTATYDLPVPFDRQTKTFASQGCRITQLKCTEDGDCTLNEMTQLVDDANIIVVSGGNTLFACDRWNKVGLSPLLRQAAEKGKVLSGGSAGAICWFDAGHSDSADPDSYKDAMKKEAEVSINGNEDESSSAPSDVSQAKPWKYIRVPCLGILPGLVCPHFDRTQSNGVLRATDFDAMLLRHPYEVGLGIDHFSALVVDENSYTVLSMSDKTGSVKGEEFAPGDPDGRPGIWRKVVDMNGKILTSLVPKSGQIDDILRVASEIVVDPGVDICRQENPST